MKKLALDVNAFVRNFFKSQEKEAKPKETGFLKETLSYGEPAVFRKPGTEEQGIVPVGGVEDIMQVPFPKKDVTPSSESVEWMASFIGDLESTEDHWDHLENWTKAYGLVDDMKNKPEATKANRRTALRLGFDLSKATSEQAREIVSLKFKEMEKELSSQIPEWGKLSPMGQALVLDAKFHTGVTFVKLAKGLVEHEKSPSKETLRTIIRESRRVETVEVDGKKEKRYVPGFDNRVAKLFYEAGFIENPRDAKGLGLDLMNM